MQDILVRLRSDAGQLTLARPPHQFKATNESSMDRSAEVRAFHANALLRLKDVCALLGISRSTIYYRVSDGSFPGPVKIGKRSVRWRAEDLDAWRRGLSN